MNLRPFILPVAALAAGSGWLVHLRSAQGDLEEANTVLRNRIAVASRATAGGPSVAEARMYDPRGGGGRKPAVHNLASWRALAAAQLAGDRSGIESLRLNLRLQSQLKALPAPDILALWDELSRSGMSREELQPLQHLFFDQAAEKDPEGTLRHFEGVLGDAAHPLAGNLGRTFGKWIGKDPTAAATWYDQALQAGKFATTRLDGRNPTQIQMTGELVKGFLARDPAAALARLQSLPETQRLEALDRSFGSPPAGSERAFANLLREGLPSQGPAAFNRFADRLAIRDGFTATAAFLDRIDATPAERKSVVESAASNSFSQLARSNGDPTALYAWLRTQSPDRADKVTGEALAVNVGRLGFDKVAAMATRLHESTGNDAILHAFLTSGSFGGDHGSAAAELAARISNPALRAEAEERIRTARGR